MQANKGWKRMLMFVVMLGLVAAVPAAAQKASGPTIVKDVDTEGKIAVNLSACGTDMTLTSGTSGMSITMCTSDNQIYWVPANSRLVLTHASARCYSGQEQPFVLMSLSTTAGDSFGVSLFLPLPLVGKDNYFSFYAAAHPFKGYADAGTKLSVGIQRGQAANSLTCRTTVSGYLISVP